MSDLFYFDEREAVIDWESREPVVMANPEWRRRDERDADRVTRALPRLKGHVWVATSGSSSVAANVSRWIALSREAFLASAGAANQHLSASAQDVWAHALPVFHVGGLGILARAHLSRSQVVACVPARWDPREFHRRVAESGATLSALVPSQIHDLVEAGLDAPPTLRAVVVGGARLDAGIYRAAVARGWPCLPSYGLTETCSQVATARLVAPLPFEAPEALCVLPHATIVADDEGRLHIRATSLLTCVAEWDGSAMRVSDPKVDGWLRTEDLGSVTDAGVVVTGRATESVKVLGEMVSLLRVEEAARAWAADEPLLRGMPLDLAVVALPHPRLNHELVLVLAAASSTARAAPEVLRDAMSQALRATLLPYERVQRVVWTGAIPRTSLGKVQRLLLVRQIGLEPRSDG